MPHSLRGLAVGQRRSQPQRASAAQTLGLPSWHRRSSSMLQGSHGSTRCDILPLTPAEPESFAALGRVYRGRKDAPESGHQVMRFGYAMLTKATLGHRIAVEGIARDSLGG